jgi:hypothetical protein
MADASPGDASPEGASPGDASPGDASPGDASPGDEVVANESVGYRRPPKAHQFKPGQSGNPLGPPKRAKGPATPYLDQIVTFEIGGKRRKMRRAAAFFAQLRRMSGDPRIARMLLEADGRIEQARHKIRITFFGEQERIEDIRRLGLARRLYPYARTARIVLEPWVVQMALDRWQAPELTREEQAEVYKATRCPHKVRWPDWWLPEFRGHRRKRGACT